jgi:hypothetical protein
MYFLLVLVLFIAGCAPSDGPSTAQLQFNQVQVFPRVSLTQEQVQLVYSGVQRVLSDPNSARFGEIFAGRQPDGTLYVCGSVDVRNNSGGYIGDQPFYGTLDQRAFTPITIGGTQEQSQAIEAYCRQQLALD